MGRLTYHLVTKPYLEPSDNGIEYEVYCITYSGNDGSAVYAYVKTRCQNFIDFRDAESHVIIEQIKSLELDVLVVVPDEVPIQWPASGPLVEVCRREEVFERSDHRIRQFRQAAGGAGPLTAPERQQLGDFLCRSHAPAT